MILKTISFIILLYVYPLWWGVYSELVEACLNRLFSYCEILGVHPYILDSGRLCFLPLPVQDGRVEERVLISSYKSTNITTNSWTTTVRRTLEPTKNISPMSKDKEVTTIWYEGHNHNKIKSHTCQVGDPQTGEQ